MACIIYFYSREESLLHKKLMHNKSLHTDFFPPLRFVKKQLILVLVRQVQLGASYKVTCYRAGSPYRVRLSQPLVPSVAGM